jgi:hypothetical protein
MHRITKRSGAQEVFRTDKIRNSIRKAGVGRESAAKTAAGIGYHEGITTSEVRNRVIGEMRALEPEAARKYELFPRKNHENTEMSH